jgi:PAS domain S-box-containing protein
VWEFFADLLEPAGLSGALALRALDQLSRLALHLSDLLIWAAYFVIPFLLINFIRQRRDVPFNRLFWLFGLFILACGTTHLLDALIFWVPVYRLSGLMRLVTAMASWGTVLALIEVMPRALLLRTPSELESIVQTRTAELAAANQQLQEVAEQLRRRNAEFTTLANNIAQLAWMAEPDGHIFWYNQRWYDYTGTTLEQMQGWGWEKVHHPDHVEAVSTRWSKFLAAGQHWEDTFPLRGADGHYRWFLSRAQPVRNEAGHITRWFGTNTDVTDMRQLQQQVQHSETRYRVLMESIPQLVWTADSAGELSYCDARTTEYTGLAASDWHGRPWQTLLHPDDAPAAAAHWEQAQHANGHFEGEYRLRRATGEYRWFLVQARRCRRGSALGGAQWFGTCTDIHEQHTLREACRCRTPSWPAPTATSTPSCTPPRTTSSSPCRTYRACLMSSNEA